MSDQTKILAEGGEQWIGPQRQKEANRAVRSLVMRDLIENIIKDAIMFANYKLV